MPLGQRGPGPHTREGPPDGDGGTCSSRRPGNCSDANRPLPQRRWHSGATVAVWHDIRRFRSGCGRSTASDPDDAVAPQGSEENRRGLSAREEAQGTSRLDTRQWRRRRPRSRASPSPGRGRPPGALSGARAANSESCSGASGLPEPDTSTDRHVRMTVTAAKGDALLLLESRRTGILAIPNLVLADRATSQALELERCIVWAWLTENPR